MTKIAHAWIREIHTGDLSSHRIGCMVAQKVSPTKARVAFSLCAPGDKMNIAKAKKLAMRRLTESKTKSIVVDVTTRHHDWATVLGIAKTADRHYEKDNRFYDEERCNGSLNGLLSEVCPTK